MSERLTKEREQYIRKGVRDGYAGNTIVSEVLAELDATRAERDLLAGLLEQSDDHFSFLPNKKTLLCISEGEWEVSGDATVYPTAIDAIRAALTPSTSNPRT